MIEGVLCLSPLSGQRLGQTRLSNMRFHLSAHAALGGALGRARKVTAMAFAPSLSRRQETA
jgi:hypothetical protein